ncbi:MAG: hypothetical protein M1826_002122 [Phylliscum demangeonii]|nr:MAG: hypothetical protein M1826_002122 [Phylliscum demangeonii]
MVERKKRVMRRTPAEEPPPPPSPLYRDNEYEDDGGLLSGEPTMQEMEQVLSKEAYDQFVIDWKNGKANRRMEYAIRRGYIMSAEEQAQHELNHQSFVEAQKLQRKVTRILVRSKRARPAMEEMFAARAKDDVVRRRAGRHAKARELKMLKALVEQNKATAAQAEKYQKMKEAKTKKNKEARAREAKAIERAEAGMAKLKPLIVTNRASKAEQRKYAQLEEYVEGKRAKLSAANKKNYRARKEREKDARDAPGQGALSDVSDQHKDHPLQSQSSALTPIPELLA